MLDFSSFCILFIVIGNQTNRIQQKDIKKVLIIFKECQLVCFAFLSNNFIKNARFYVVTLMWLFCKYGHSSQYQKKKMWEKDYMFERKISF